MLTPSEVHLLAGMMVLASSEPGEEVELGSTLTDHASGTLRDIDVTVQCRIGGTLHVLAGIEVKAHRRPLDIEDVEQLVIKLSDVAIPVGKRAIVSASGYSAAARAKARSHNVLLYSLIPWCAEMEKHDTPFKGSSPPLLVECFWSKGPHVHVQIEETEEARMVNSGVVEVLIEERDGTMSRRPISVLSKNCADSVADLIDRDWPQFQKPGQESRDVAQRVDFQNRVLVVDGERQFRVPWVGVHGIRTQKAIDGKDTLRFLVEAETLNPIVSCSVRTLSGGELLFLALDQRTRRLALQAVSSEVRGKNKIYRLPMTRGV